MNLWSISSLFGVRGVDEHQSRESLLIRSRVSHRAILEQLEARVLLSGEAGSPDDHADFLQWSEATVVEMDEGGIASGVLASYFDTDLFVFRFADAGPVTVTIETPLSELDPYLRIYNADHVWIAVDDDSGLGFDALVSFDAEAGEDYYVVVSSFKGFMESRTGEYEVVIESLTPQPPSGSNPLRMQMGEKLWSRQFGSSSRESANAMISDGAGGAILAGFTEGNLFSTNAGERDIVLTRVDVDGINSGVVSLAPPATILPRVWPPTAKGVSSSPDTQIAICTEDGMGGSTRFWRDSTAPAISCGGHSLGPLLSMPFGISNPMAPGVFSLRAGRKVLFRDFPTPALLMHSSRESTLLGALSGSSSSERPKERAAGES